MSNPTPRKSKAAFFVGLTIFLCLALVALNLWRARNKEVSRVETAAAVPVAISPAVKGELDWFTDVTGNLLPIRAAAVYAKIPGKIIEEIFVEKGDWVEKGQMIVSLEKDQIQTHLNRARASVELAQAQVDVLEKDFSRIENLYQTKTVPKQKLDHAQAELNVARARLKEAQAALKEIEVLYKDHNIYAPLAGIVADRFVDPGNLTDKELRILTIYDERVLKLELTVAEKELSHIQKGMEVSFTVDAWPGRSFSGTVAIIHPTIDPATRTLKLEIHVENDGFVLRSGMFAHVRLYFGKKQALLIQRESLNKMPGTGSYYVYAVDKGNACLKNIEIGIQQGNLVEVLSGLAEGDPVVIQGQNRLRDGAAVEVVDKVDAANP